MRIVVGALAGDSDDEIIMRVYRWEDDQYFRVSEEEVRRAAELARARIEQWGGEQTDLTDQRFL